MQLRQPSGKNRRSLLHRLISLALVVCGPALLWAAIVWIEEMYAPRPRSPRHYWLLPLALTPGIAGVWLQDLRKRALGLAVLAYTAAMLPVLLVVEFVIVCASFGRCL